MGVLSPVCCALDVHQASVTAGLRSRGSVPCKGATTRHVSGSLKRERSSTSRAPARSERSRRG